MHHANHHCGHAPIPARYRRIAEPMHPPRIPGYPRHGGNIAPGIAVNGDSMVLDNADMTFGGEPRLHRRWPEVHGRQTDDDACHQLARVRPGADEPAGPDELRKLPGRPEEGYV